MSRNYACNLCEKSCYLKNLKECKPYGYICKDCRVKLGLETYDTIRDDDPRYFWNKRD